MKHIADRVDLRFNIVLFGLFAAVSIAGYLGFQQIRQELLNEQLTINAAKTESLVKRVDQWLITRKTEVSTLEDTDMAAAIARLDRLGVVLDAAQASFARVSRLSLWDEIR